MNFKKTLQIVLGAMLVVAPVAATATKRKPIQKPTQKAPNKTNPKAKPRWDSA